MIKNIFLTVLVALTTALPATARFNGANREAPAAHIGIRAGVGFSEYGNLNRPKELITPVGGIHLDIKVAKLPIYIETGAYYMDKGCRYEGVWNSNHEFTDHNHSILTPAVASYHFYIGKNMTLQPFTGFYTAYGFDYEKLDFGLREGVAFTYNNFYTNMGINAGVVEQDGDQEHVSLFLTVGVNF